MTLPTATYRLQLRREFGFDDARRVVPYLQQLGISHLYLSPVTTARRGSVHGYDVTDYGTINPELGGLEGFERLCHSARAAGLGVILDIVPNHMSATPENSWWRDVLQYGADSRHASVFDIDWNADQPGLRGKLLLPILARSYVESIASGELALAFDAESQQFVVQFFEKFLPLAPESDPRKSLQHATTDAVLAAYETTSAEGRLRLHLLLEAQHYRLAFWQVARDSINWRRFFEINDLVGVRVDDEAVFEATHAMVFGLYRDGLIDGVRVDHVDGLADPGTYCRRLRQRLDALGQARQALTGGDESGRAWIVVEKILGAKEELPADWPVDGSTGYDFMKQVLGVLIDPGGEGDLDRVWRAQSESALDFEAEEKRARRQILDENLRSELARATGSLAELAAGEAATREISRAALDRTCRALLLGLRVYRPYGSAEHPDIHLDEALQRARGALGRPDHPSLDQLAAWLRSGSGANAGAAEPALAQVCARFGQLAAPLAAKSVEDTAFYRYGRLLAINEVGGDATCFGMSPAAFHRAMAERARIAPFTLNATATHDHKRGEDLRARLAVLSEAGALWEERVQDWHRRAQNHRSEVSGGTAPDGADEYMLFQMLVGAWPLELEAHDRNGCQDFIGRLKSWSTKALREAKRHSNWLAPDEEYEAASLRYLDAICAAPEDAFGPAAIADLVRQIEVAGALNGLSQTFLRMTAPGIPDQYQGTERWDFSLVDPDNRSPVDYPLRTRAAAEPVSWPALLASWRDGRIKQALIAAVLAARRHDRTEHGVYAGGTYEPLPTGGHLGRSLLGFRRSRGAGHVLCIATRLAFGVLEGLPHIAPERWRDTHVVIGADLPVRWNDLLTGRPLAAEAGALDMRTVLQELPVALLVPAA